MILKRAANAVLRAAYKAVNISGPQAHAVLGVAPHAISTTSAMTRSSVAYSCIRRIAQDVSGVPLLLLRDPTDPTSVIPATHPTQKLFDNPAPDISTEQFIQYLAMWLQYRGEYFVVFDNPDNPTIMQPANDPLIFRTIKATTGELLGFETVTASPQQYIPSDLLRHRFINPDDPHRGLAPIKAAASSLSIDVTGDILAADIVAKGGETGLIYETEENMDDEQRERELTWLRSRRNPAGQVPKDMLLEGKMKLMDPKFTAFDYQIFERMPVATQKICMVYGISPSLIGEDEAPNYATFDGRVKIYWRQTLVPIITGMEYAFDSFFAQGSDKVYVRWDRSKIAGLKADAKEVAETAKIMHDSGLPWTVINAKLNMELDLTMIPGADEVMVPATSAPLTQLINDWEYLPPNNAVNIQAGQAPGRSKALTNAEIVTRSTDPLTIAQRNRQLGGLEREVQREWRGLNFQYRKKVLAIWNKAVKDTDTVDEAYPVFVNEIEPLLIDEMAEESVDIIQPRSIRAGEIGESGIETLVTQEAAFDGINTKQGRLSPKTLAEIMKRENLIVDLTDSGLFDPIRDSVFETINEAGELGDVKTEVQRSLDAQKEIKHNFNNSANRAVTIARQEVGTGFNVGRFNEMKAQKFKKHRWLANAGDPDTRDSHNATHEVVQEIGKTFQPIGLKYPQDPAGPLEDIMGCRCLTVPEIDEE